MKQLNTFMKRNIIPQELAEKSPLIMSLLHDGHKGFVLKDETGNIRFHHTIQQSSDVVKWLEQLDSNGEHSAFILEIYEHVFAHKQFTGRSGIMYKYEGIGCIYWHQNSKFMLSLQEVFTNAAAECNTNSTQLLELKDTYYRLQSGFGFHKTPKQWGAFPLEPYSHTPYGMPAQQPGMTGQVKEDILTRMAELGVRVKDGAIHFDMSLLNLSEFLTEPTIFRYIDVNGEWCEFPLPEKSLAFTICQVPVVYRLSNKNTIMICTNEMVYGSDFKSVLGVSSILGASLSRADSLKIFARLGIVYRIEIWLNEETFLEG